MNDDTNPTSTSAKVSTCKTIGYGLPATDAAPSTAATTTTTTTNYYYHCLSQLASVTDPFLLLGPTTTATHYFAHTAN